MTYELQVKEHLRNGALYRPLSEPLLSSEWKHRLFRQRMLRQQLEAALEERPRLFNKFVRVGTPVLCVAFTFAVFFGLINPAGWSETLVVEINNHVPFVGLKETFLFIAVVNGLTLLVRKRSLLFS
jgi:hypothetical protein